MKTNKEIFTDCIEELITRFKNIRAIETGTIRSYEENTKSTLHISHLLKGFGNLISVDNNEESIKISQHICREQNNITYILSDSVEYIEKCQEKFHFAYLDSENNQVTAYKEFRALIPVMAEGSIILVDNAGLKLDGSIDVKSEARKGGMIMDFIDGVTEYELLESYHGNKLKITFRRKDFD